MGSNGGINSLSASQISQINKLASKKGAENKVLVAKFKGKEVKFSAEKPKISSKNKQEKPVKGADLAVKTLGLKDRKVSPAMAQKLIIAWKASEGTHASLPDIQLLNEHLASSDNPPPDWGSTTSLDSAKGSSISGSHTSLNTLHSGWSSTSSLDSAIGSSISGSTQSLDSLDAEGEPIFGTFQPKPHYDKESSLSGSTGSINTWSSDWGSTSSLNGSISGSTQSLDSLDAADIGLQVNTGKPEITFEPAGDLDLPPDYPAPPPPRPPKGKAGKQPPLPPRPPKSSSRTQLTPHTELSRLHKKFGINIRPIEINGSPVGYIFSNPRTQGEPRPTTLLVEAHGGGYYAGGEKIPPFTTPVNTRFLMSARRNQTFEVAPWMQADAISRGQIDFSHDDQIYGSMDHGSGISMTNYHLSPITKEQGDKYDLSLEKTAQLMQFFKLSAKADGRINNFNMFMLDPNMSGHVSTQDLMKAFSQQGVEYKNIIMNVCRPQQKGEVSMTKALDNIERAKQNRLSQMGPRVR
ncbi:putative adhesin [Endozoicomonas elysicola]|uniref:Putative adhesin Stv domain-containing protein n=2 Tax=Endozoicomonas elysicola TaxID=305900 RepID=A0A081K5K7_9GAMM|nr:hypothetical protein [Endozoicomonas elysicola]KEI69433.1 hypothetical protein GV64_00620 [Endozoicomonas elysicola]